MKIIHCNLCVKQGRVECRPEDLMQIKMKDAPYCVNSRSLRSDNVSMVPAVRFCQKHLDEPLDKLLQIIEKYPRGPGTRYYDYIRQLNKALEEEN